MSDSAGAIASTYSRPALVSATLRVVRLKSRTPRRFSRLATALPIAVGDMSRSRAAARKLPSLAMATTASSSTNPLFALSRFSRYDIAVYLNYRDGQSPSWCNDHQRHKGGWNVQSPYHQHHLRHHDARLPRIRSPGS